MTREIDCLTVREKIADAILQAVSELPSDVQHAIKRARDIETNPLHREIFDVLIENYKLAERNHLPLCQDTGMLCVYVEIGQDVHIIGGKLDDAINQAVSQTYTQGFLRKSMCDPVSRVNTCDNTPAFIDYEIVPGDKISFLVVPKGGGCENMSKATILKVSDGIDGVEKFILQCAEQAGSAPCPPYILGIGIGGNLEICAKLSKKALYKNLDMENPNSQLSALETKVMDKINGLEITKAKTTCLRVHIETYPTHITSLPVCVSFGCNSMRRVRIVL